MGLLWEMRLVGDCQEFHWSRIFVYSLLQPSALSSVQHIVVIKYIGIQKIDGKCGLQLYSTVNLRINLRDVGQTIYHYHYYHKHHNLV